MTYWYDPAKDLETQAVACFGPRDGSLWMRRAATPPAPGYPGSVVIEMGGNRRRVEQSSLSSMARLLARFGWAFRFADAALLPARRNPLLNSAAVANRTSVRDRYRRAKRELTQTASLWDAVKGVRAQILDKRMIEGVVKMAAQWPEVMGIAYDGGSFESYQGVVVAPEDTICVSFWPVFFPGEVGNTSGLTGIAEFNIDTGGHVRWSSPAAIHPHFFSNGTICGGSAEKDFDSQLHSLEVLRHWWVGTDGSPANDAWSKYAADFWADYGEEFFKFFEGGTMRMQTWRPGDPWYRRRDNPYSAAQIALVPVTDDGLNIPGLSLPEYTVSHGVPSYIRAPEQSDGGRVREGDKRSEATILTLDRDTLGACLENNVIEPYAECYLCARAGDDPALTEDDAYICDLCGNYVCEGHYEGDGVCEECFHRIYAACQICEVYGRRDDMRTCDTCMEDFCEQHSNWYGGDEYEREGDFCDRHAPDRRADDDEDEEVLEETPPTTTLAADLDAPVDPNWTHLAISDMLWCCHPEHDIDVPGARAQWRASWNEVAESIPEWAGRRQRIGYIGVYACDRHVPRQVPAYFAATPTPTTYHDDYVPIEGRTEEFGPYECEWPNHDEYMQEKGCRAEASWVLPSIRAYSESPTLRGPVDARPHFICNQHHTLQLTTNELDFLGGN